MSETLLSSVQTRAWGRNAVPVATTGDSASGKSGEARVHFHDFLQGVNPRHEREEPEMNDTPVLNGSAQDLAALSGQTNTPGHAQLALDAATQHTSGTGPEPWTLMAPSVERSSASARLATTAPFRIYARAAETRIDPGTTSSTPSIRDEETTP
ncbi:MAG: hypothetical protein HQL91_10595 [Magnetococcales bacterium]|nr:hypothetical protein [Magnetococcales bacterium]